MNEYRLREIKDNLDTLSNRELVRELVEAVERYKELADQHYSQKCLVREEVRKLEQLIEAGKLAITSQKKDEEV